MKKSVRLIKRLEALFLVLLFSIDRFAAVVSDNDGSAFITKAEFDSLKNDFQSQIDFFEDVGSQNHNSILIDSETNATIFSVPVGNLNNNLCYGFL